MPINKVIYGNQTIIDLSTDTLSSADQLAQGIVAHDRSGALIAGAIIDGNPLEYGLTDGTLPMVGVGKVGSAEI